MPHRRTRLLAMLILAGHSIPTGVSAADRPVFSAMDVFALEWVTQPRISPDGRHVVYRRMGFDVMTDQRRGNLWIIGTNGMDHRKLTSFEGDERGAR